MAKKQQQQERSNTPERSNPSPSHEERNSSSGQSEILESNEQNVKNDSVGNESGTDRDLANEEPVEENSPAARSGK